MQYSSNWTKVHLRKEKRKKLMLECKYLVSIWGEEEKQTEEQRGGG
jgi:hypothetical protein